MTTIYIGDFARQTCNSILENGDFHHSDIGTVNSKGYWKEDDKWIAYDNTTYDCWIEEFETMDEAIDWLAK